MLLFVLCVLIPLGMLFMLSRGLTPFLMLIAVVSGIWWLFKQE
jgi:hypothetical protein